MNMNMNFEILKNIENEEINKNIVNLCSEGTEIYIVGGYVRDLVLERVYYDKDYVVKGEKAVEFAKKVAELVQGYYVLLDVNFDIARVVMPDKKNTLDFAGCLNQNIYDDLARRDYTVNAIAYRINSSESVIIDPFNGLADIKNKKIRAISEQNLVDDPLRLLRAFRHAAQLDFEIENQTLELVNKHKALINNVSVERIQVELIKLFESNQAAKSLNSMKEIEFLDEIFPEISTQRNVPPNLHHHLGLIDHSIESVRQIELKQPDLPEWVNERLNEEMAVGIKYLSLLKLSALLHDLGKPSTWQIDELGRHRFIKHEDVGADIAVDLLKRLKFSKNAIKYIIKLIKYHIYPSHLLRSEHPGVTQPEPSEEDSLTGYPSDKALMRFFRKIENEVPELVILAMADRLSARGPEITDDIVNKNISGLSWILEKYKESKEKVESLPKLLSGNDVMEILELPKGPEVGKVLKALKEAQISGDIVSRDEAVAFIKGYEFEKIRS